MGSTTQTLANRVKEHRLYSPNGKAKEAWRKQVLSRGATIEIRPLSWHDSAVEMRKAESKWIAFWRQYCDVLNVDRPGDGAGLWQGEYWAKRVEKEKRQWKGLK